MEDPSPIIQSPHVIVFPSPLKSQINPMFDIAELLCLSGVQVTLLLIPQTHDLLLRHVHIDSRLNPYPNFHLHTISHGLPPDHSPSSDPAELLDSLETVIKPLLKDRFTSGKLTSDERGPVSCIVSDGIMSFVYDIGNEIQLPVITALTLSPCSVWAISNLPTLVSDPMKSALKRVPGIEGILTSDDLARMWESRDVDHYYDYSKYIMKQVEELPRAHGLILNTFKALDGPILSQISSICPNVYAIGPIHTHLGVRQEANRMTPYLNYYVDENKNCIMWLDSQQPKSAIYVNIENHVELTRVEMLELWNGLVNSGKRFLWVRRPSSKLGEGRVSPKILNATKARGCIVDSMPAMQVLAHKAIGGFLTRGQWDSTLESIVEGIPIICCPTSWDEQVNSKFVSKGWKVGMSMDKRLDRNVIEKTIRDVMGSKNELMENANKMKKLGAKSVSKGGSSYVMLDHLVDDIRLMHP